MKMFQTLVLTGLQPRQLTNFTLPGEPMFQSSQASPCCSEWIAVEVPWTGLVGHGQQLNLAVHSSQIGALLVQMAAQRQEEETV